MEWIMQKKKLRGKNLIHRLVYIVPIEMALVHTFQGVLHSAKEIN